MTERRLKVAFVVDRFGARFGGAEAYGVELMREISKTSDVTVFARDYDDACGLGLPFVAIRAWNGWPSWVRVLLFAIRVARRTRRGFDIVHSHMNGWCGDIEVVHVTPVRYNWRIRPMPLLKRALSAISPRVQTYLALEARRVASRPGHCVVSVSGVIAQQLRQAYPDRPSTPVIAPGVAWPQSALPGQRGKTRCELGWSDRNCVCLLVARNPLRKGLPTIMKALALLPAHYTLLLVGADSEAADFVGKWPDAGLADRVRLIRATPDVAAYYRAADVYVHPTLNDSFGMAPLEAMSFGLPVVVSPSPWCGFAQYVRDQHDALVLSHPENAAQLADYIRRIQSNASLRARLLRGGAQVVSRHSWSDVARQYRSLYQQVLDER